jgi:hypothetical protein
VENTNRDGGRQAGDRVSRRSAVAGAPPGLRLTLVRTLGPSRQARAQEFKLGGRDL